MMRKSKRSRRRSRRRSRHSTTRSVRNCRCIPGRWHEHACRASHEVPAPANYRDPERIVTEAVIGETSVTRQLEANTGIANTDVYCELVSMEPGSCVELTQTSDVDVSTCLELNEPTRILQLTGNDLQESIRAVMISFIGFYDEELGKSLIEMVRKSSDLTELHALVNESDLRELGLPEEMIRQLYSNIKQE